MIHSYMYKFHDNPDKCKGDLWTHLTATNPQSLSLTEAMLMKLQVPNE